jgi:putative Mg2+ transporter-C (MgtC) family protein
MTLNEFIQLIDTPQITFISAMYKLVLAILAGGLVGLNRERQKQPAGFRTHILICVGACLLMILSIYIPQNYFNFKNGDPGRIAAQVVSGIGFLGAGAIMRLGTNVRGITTAASIWLISAIGLTIGAGLYSISFFTLILALFTLIILEKVEHRFFPQFVVKTLKLVFTKPEYPGDEIKTILHKGKIDISDISINIHNRAGMQIEISLIVKMSENLNFSQVINDLNSLPNIESLKIS